MNNIKTYLVPIKANSNVSFLTLPVEDDYHVIGTSFYYPSPKEEVGRIDTNGDYILGFMNGTPVTITQKEALNHFLIVGTHAKSMKNWLLYQRLLQSLGTLNIENNKFHEYGYQRLMQSTGKVDSSQYFEAEFNALAASGFKNLFFNFFEHKMKPAKSNALLDSFKNKLSDYLQTKETVSNNSAERINIAVASSSYKSPGLFEIARSNGVSLIIDIPSFISGKDDGDDMFNMLIGNTFTKIFVGKQAEEDVQEISSQTMPPNFKTKLLELQENEAFIFSPSIKCKITVPSINFQY